VETRLLNKNFIQCSVDGLSEMRKTGTLSLIFKNL
jgi:hypothetical protein